MDISCGLYKVFCHTAVTLSFSEASKQFPISQSTVNQSIKVLEKKFNQPLFIRNTRKVQLTPEKEILLKHIEPAMSLVKEEENQLLEAHTLNGGRLRIETSDTIYRCYLILYLNRSHEGSPNTHIRVIDQTSIERVKPLENEQADFIVANYPNSALADSMNIRATNRFCDMLMASCSVFPLEGPRMSLKELLHCPIMMLNRENTISEFLHQVFRKSQLDLVPGIELSSDDLLTDLARIGLGITFIPDFCIPQSDEELFILDLKEQLPSRQMMVAYSKSPPVSQATRQFMDMLQEADV